MRLRSEPTLHHLTGRSMVIVAVVALVAAGAGASAWALTSGSDSGYRTAAVRTGDVQETLDETGTLQPVSTADLSFQVAGQVASVSVSVGQQVSEGQVLATLSTSSLTSDVDNDESTVTAAQDKLETDEASETSTASATSDSSSASTSASTSATTARPSGTGQSASAASTIAADQATLTADQHQADLDSSQAQSDLDAATSLCTGSGSASGIPAGSGSSTDGTSSGSGSGSSTGAGTADGTTTVIQRPGTTTSTTSTPSTPSTTTTTTTIPASCTTALEQVLTDQKTVSKDETAVSDAESALAKALESEGSDGDGSTGGSGTTTGGAGQGASESGQGDTGSGSQGSTFGGSTSSESSSASSPDQIAADQASLDADEAALSEAQTSLDEGEVVSPIAGTVATVGLSAGENVAADSSTDQVVVIGPQTFEVSTTVPVTDVSEIAVGQKAYVVPDGQGAQLTGQVTQIGPPPTSSSSTDYPVVISLPTGVQNLFDGATASASIVIGQVTNVVTVPTSAVHELGHFTYVSELRDGKLDEADVKLGIMGDELTQVKSGLKSGATVVLANLSEPLPSSNTSGVSSFAGEAALEGTGGFPGGGGAFVRRIGGGGG